MLEVSIAEARNALTKLVRQTESGEIVHITRRGNRVAVLVSSEEYGRLVSGEPRKDFWQAIDEWRAGTSFDWPELTPEEVGKWRDRRPSRDFSWPG